MSEMDYKYVETVTISDNDPPSTSDYTQVCHLQLLVHDERLEDANWVNAKLAGQLWLQPVLDFYLDHLVIKENDVDDADSDEEGEISGDWVDQYMLGFHFLQEDLENVSIEKVLETVSIEVEEWRSVMDTLEHIDEDDEDLEVILLSELLEKSLKVENDSKKMETLSPVKKEIVNTSYHGDNDDTSSEDDEEHQILLFQVVLRKETSEEENELHEVLMDLEYLRDTSPEKLLEFLQSKLIFVIEDDEKEV